MKKFEYKTVPLSRKASFWEGTKINVQQLEAILNNMGQEGWELTTSIEKSEDLHNHHFMLIFKREIPN